MQRFKIPNSFMLHGQKIRVQLVDHIGSENGTLGEARIAKNEIAIQNNANGFSRIPEQLEQTFLHEMVHFILHHMGQNDLCEQEIFVDGMSHLLHQAFTSMEYTVDKNSSNGKVGKRRG